MAETPKLPNLVQRFFTQHLCEHKNASPRTITAYRDTFRLFFGFLQEQPAVRQPIFRFPIWTHPPFLPSSNISNPNGTMMHAREICD